MDPPAILCPRIQTRTNISAAHLHLQVKKKPLIRLLLLEIIQHMNHLLKSAIFKLWEVYMYIDIENKDNGQYMYDKWV